MGTEETGLSHVFGGSAQSTPVPVCVSSCHTPPALQFNFIPIESSLFSQDFIQIENVPVQATRPIYAAAYSAAAQEQRKENQAQDFSHLFGGSVTSTPAPVCVFPSTSISSDSILSLAPSDILSQTVFTEEAAETDPSPRKSC